MSHRFCSRALLEGEGGSECDADQMRCDFRALQPPGAAQDTGWWLRAGRVPCAEDRGWCGEVGGEGQGATSQVTVGPGTSKCRSACALFPATKTSATFQGAQNNAAETNTTPTTYSFTCTGRRLLALWVRFLWDAF